MKDWFANMSPYLFMLISAPVLLYISHNVIKNKGLRVLLEVVAVAIPCIFAGLRSPDVGTDMTTYGEWGFIQAQTASWAEYYGTVKGWHPFGYSLVTWLVGHFTRCRMLYFGLIQALCLVPTYLSIRRLNPSGSWAGMLTYLLVIFPFSLNGMKQAIACGLGSLFFWLLIESRYIFFVVSVLVGSLFHPTAIFLFLLMPVILLVKKGEIVVKGRTFSLRIAALLLMTSAFILLFVAGRVFIPYVAQLRDSFGFLLERMQDGGLNKSAIILGASWVPVCCLGYKVLRQSISGTKGRDVSLYTAISLYSLAGFIGLQLDVIALSMARLAYFGLIFLPLFMAFAVKLAGEKTGGGKTRTALIVSIGLFFTGLAAYFLYQTVICRVSEVFPFTFY